MSHNKPDLFGESFPTSFQHVSPASLQKQLHAITSNLILSNLIALWKGRQTLLLCLTDLIALLKGRQTLLLCLTDLIALLKGRPTLL